MMLRSDVLGAVPRLRHAFFTRVGGVSEGVWASLNMSLRSADDPARVAVNRARAAATWSASSPWRRKTSRRWLPRVRWTTRPRPR